MNNEVVNLTGRAITTVNEKGENKTYFPDGTAATTKICPIHHGIIDGIEIVSYDYNAVENLPEPEEGVTFIVSFAVLEALKGSRKDVVAPDSSPSSVIRDASGRTLAVKKFRKL